MYIQKVEGQNVQVVVRTMSPNFNFPDSFYKISTTKRILILLCHTVVDVIIWAQDICA